LSETQPYFTLVLNALPCHTMPEPLQMLFATTTQSCMCVKVVSYIGLSNGGENGHF